MIFVLLIGVIAALWFIIQAYRVTIYVDTGNNEPWELIGGGGERIYLKFGVIYAFIDDPNKEYYIVNLVLHVTADQYKKMIFFNTPEGAEAAGYRPSKSFEEDYNCVKQGLDAFECYKDQ